jgi:hypothetical protein
MAQSDGITKGYSPIIDTLREEVFRGFLRACAERASQVLLCLGSARKKHAGSRQPTEFDQRIIELVEEEYVANDWPGFERLNGPDLHFIKVAFDYNLVEWWCSEFETWRALWEKTSDLWLLRRGEPWLVSVKHEDILSFQTTERDFQRLQSALPGLKLK